MHAGTIVALLSASSMLGLQLETIAVIASALSVGLGFGLQSIVENLVSGVILLIERPVKQGDWVSVAGAERTIPRIRVHATELTTADGGTAIVRNASFVSSNVSNRSDPLASQRLDLVPTASEGSASLPRCALHDLLQGFEPIRQAPPSAIF